ncbi:hypothetical protein QAD02_000278 [Eretmocerus hayati]|uniref:Uncharacterized protein n=1 Tax=Eretmocerus hayati TaxID=131215 RepID=A0ACC2NFA4_9HYME|nr:hypothetical protein QAD02_000278 [Eretmocerus hayati]
MIESDQLLQPNIFILFIWMVFLSHFWLKDNSDSNDRFRRLSLRYHPERSVVQASDIEIDGCCQPGDADAKKRVEAFAIAAEAYEVLSDPLRRAVYDQYGERGLKNHLRGPDGCIKPYVYHGQPLRTYREFFGTENPYADLLDNFGNTRLPDCPEPPPKKKDEPLIKALPLSLNEVFYGGVKKMKIQRLVLVGGDGDDCGDDNNKGATALEEKILSIPIMPGMPSGMKIVFPEEGDQGPTKIPADVVFVTEDKPHDIFQRDGSDLRMTAKVFLSEALTGTVVTLHTVDDRLLRVPITSVISPDYVKRISGEGLPLIDDPDHRGDLIIDFEIEFPAYLGSASKSLIKRAFDPREIEAEEERHRNKSSFGNERVHRMLLDGKMYMRANKLSEMCRP